MSVHSDNQSLLETSETNEVPAHELSGDENAERSVLLSDIRVEKSNFFLTTMTIMKTVIGVGILGLPYAVSQLGWALALGIFLVTMLLTQYACVLLLKVKNLSHHSNYSTIGYSVFKSRVFQALMYFLVLFNNVGICIAELTIFKETLKGIVLEFRGAQIDGLWAIQPWFTVGICLAVLLLPFVIVEKIQRLRFLALIGISAISIFVVTVIYNFFDATARRDWTLPKDISAWPPGDEPLKAIAVVPNILLAFLYQMNFFPIYKGMKESSDKRMLNSSWVASLACYVIYMSVAFLGYLTYGAFSDGINPRPLQTNFLRILEREEIGDVLFIIMNCVFLISVLCSFPVIFFGARNNFIAFVASFRRGEKDIRNSRIHRSCVDEISEYIIDQSKQRKKRKARIIFYLLTLALFGTIVTLAVTVGRLGPIFNLVGAIASNSIGFILPTLFYMVLVWKKRKPRRIHFWASVVLFCTAVPFGIFAVVTEFLE